MGLKSIYSRRLKLESINSFRNIMCKEVLCLTVLGTLELTNASHWLDQKNYSFPSPTCSEYTKWETTTVCISVAEEAIIKATGGVNVPLE